ncbi:CaiB/BaiF CoA transferase family protein [Variovorax sp. SRS16]|uniref:CaiB/BaiF CoA transferase family protein n=1 Tax=Variovorax sp. SRS16 TaxID=282217 RepID=UPI0013A5A13C|nr:CoA transferase [Variovorax sp. SRS16]
MTSTATTGPLQGLRILDISTVIAGPWSTTLLADLGAEVLKVEMPGSGDALRALPPYKEGVPLWWKVANRNKRGITLDLRREEGRALLGQLLPDYDVLVENFRPGTLDGWGITREWLHGIRPSLTILRVTGFGQTGPYRNRPGFARVFEAMTGFTNICGEPDGTPLHLGFPVADAVAGLFGALGILSALYRQQRSGEAVGQEIDCSLMESMFRVLDFLPIEYDQLGVVRQRSGNISQYAAPGNVYRTRDGRWASIAASTQRIYERLCAALGRADLADDPRFVTNPLRVAHRAELDAILAGEIAMHDLDALGVLLEKNEVGFSPIYDIADIFRDAHFAARKAIVDVPDEDFGSVRMQSVVPVFSQTPGAVRTSGPSLGQHNADVFAQLGLTAAQIGGLREAGVI